MNYLPLNMCNFIMTVTQIPQSRMYYLIKSSDSLLYFDSCNRGYAGKITRCHFKCAIYSFTQICPAMMWYISDQQMHTGEKPTCEMCATSLLLKNPLK